jgi:threonine/homoserine/homoserine lactone efflux protein
LNEIYQLGIGFIVALSGVLIPGPLLVFVISKSFSQGAKTGPLATLGHAVVELGLVAALLLGLSLILKEPAIQGAVGIIGGGLLIVYGLLNVLKARSAQGNGNGPSTFKYNTVVGSMLFSSILNPSVPLWWATIGLAMLMEAFLTTSVLGVALWLVGHLLADLSWYSLVSYLASVGRKFRQDLIYRVVIVACGLVLIFFGVTFILKYGPILI